MEYSDSAIKKRIKQPKNSRAIAQARAHEDMIAVFSTGKNCANLYEQYAEYFVPELKETILKTFSMHTKPLLSPDSGTIYAHFNKINDTLEGKTVQRNFSDEAAKKEYIHKLDKTTPKALNFDRFFSKKIFNKVIYKPNSRLIIDFPAEENATNSPELKIAELPDIHDIDEDTEEIHLLILKSENRSSYLKAGEKQKTYFFVFDAKKYQTWEGSVFGKLEKIAEHKHNFGCCPALSLGANMYLNNGIIKKSPLSDSIADLYDYNFVVNTTKYYQWQNGLPLHFGIEKDCTATDPETEAPCENGFFVSFKKDENGKNTTIRKKCPACERRKKEKMRFGKKIDFKYEDFVQHPQLSQNLQKMFGFVSIDKDTMQFNQELIQQKATKIEQDITGRTFNSNKSKEALNETHVEASLDDKQNNLTTFASRIEGIQEWAENFLGKILFPEHFLNVNVFYGRKFFLKNLSTQYNDYTKLLQSEADEYLIAQKSYELVFREYKHDKLFMKIYNLTNAVIPFRYIPTKELLANADKFQQTEMLYRMWLVRINASQWIEELLLTKSNYIIKLMKKDKTVLKEIKKWFDEKANEVINN